MNKMNSIISSISSLINGLTNEDSRTIYALKMFALYTIFIGFPYAILNFISAWRGATTFNPQTVIDTSIPFVWWSVFIYATFYLYVPLTAFLMSGEMSSRTANNRFFSWLFLTSLFCFACFLFFPVSVLGRPNLEKTGPSWSEFLFQQLYSIDPAFNAWPSLHIVHTILMTLFLVRWKSNHLQSFRFFPHLAWLNALLISISTMTTKQHYVFDVVTGALIAMIVWMTFIQQDTALIQLQPSSSSTNRPS